MNCSKFPLVTLILFLATTLTLDAQREGREGQSGGQRPGNRQQQEQPSPQQIADMMQAQLELTDEQASEVKTIVQENRNEVRKMRQSMRGKSREERQSIQQQMRAKGQEMNVAIANLLTDEQKERMAEIHAKRQANIAKAQANRAQGKASEDSEDKSEDN